MLAHLSLVLLAGFGPQKEVFVHPTGSDMNLGTAAKPVASLAGARDRARVLGAHRIWIRNGTYTLREGVLFDQKDNGLMVSALPKAHPLFMGGLDIPPSLIKRCTNKEILDRVVDVSARTQIMEVDLKQLGISNLDAVTGRGFSSAPAPAPEELFQNFRPGVLARWPNTGYVKVGTVTEPGNGEYDRDKPKRMPVFDAGDRAKLWGGASDLWLYGYWNFDWADESIAVKKVDASTGTITLAKPHVYGVAKGSPFFAENLVEELDQPGEYFIDRAAVRLYFIPSKSEGGQTSFQISILKQPMISVEGASSLSFKGLTLAISRGDGISVKNCESTVFESCRFDSIGARAAVVEGGHKSGLLACDITRTGEGGVSLSGGNRSTLEAAQNFVSNCDIGEFQRRSQTYRPAVLIAGVGNIVRHTAMHDAPHSAIIYGGNNHVIENNEFYRTVALTGDGGVVYCGRDWTARGTAIQNNWFHDNVGQRKWEPAIYVDDQGSGIKMIGNLIERCHWGFLIGGGRENIIEHNVLVDCDLAFDCDARGLGWAAKSRPTMLTNLNAVPYQSPIWRSSYPELPDILNQDPMAPAGNLLVKNLLVRSGKVEQRMEEAFKKSATIKDNLEVKSEAQVAAFLLVSKKEMGLITNKSRAAVPPKLR